MLFISDSYVNKPIASTVFTVMGKNIHNAIPPNYLFLLQTEFYSENIVKVMYIWNILLISFPNWYTNTFIPLLLENEQNMLKRKVSGGFVTVSLTYLCVRSTVRLATPSTVTSLYFNLIVRQLACVVRPIQGELTDAAVFLPP